MNTPIYDFVKKYNKSQTLRLHMPGHKGRAFLGCEADDITEINGADSLYHADGIIRESEENASRLFGTARTVYSTEGSSLCIRTMLYLVKLYAASVGRSPRILAGRNAHSSFISSAAVLGIDLSFIYPGSSYLSGCFNGDSVRRALDEQSDAPIAIYITSPDYLGRIADVSSIAEVCRKRGLLLLVDNAHGAYLKFLSPSRHPIDLGAHLCCDSAHKTLPVLTGGAYLHISKSAPRSFSDNVKTAMALFGSTSPSYLTLQSLDLANAYIYNGYAERLGAFIKKADALKDKLRESGYSVFGDEPLKLTLLTKPRGYNGSQISNMLRSSGIEVEFSDPDFVVMMLSPELEDAELCHLLTSLNSIRLSSPITELPPTPHRPKAALPPRAAIMLDSEELPVSECLGKVVASINITCPPAVPLAVCGEIIDERTLKAFNYYGILSCRVAKPFQVN